jgi:DNA polymerase III delta prime subunit
MNGNEQKPRWLRELDRFLAIKNLLFVHGNILDLITYPVQRRDGTKFWTDTDIASFFKRYLAGRGYEVVGICDPMEGLEFASDSMAELYRGIRKGKPSRSSSDRNQRETDLPCDRESLAVQEVTASSEVERARSATARKRSGRMQKPEELMNELGVVLANREVPCAFVFNLASRLITAPSRLSLAEREFFTKVLKASLSSQEVFRDGRRWNNVLILVCDKLNDLPAFLYLNNPRSRSIAIPVPDTREREQLFRRTYSAFYRKQEGGQTDPAEPPEDLVAEFGAITDGLTNYEMRNLVRLSETEKVPIINKAGIQKICGMYKYGVEINAWKDLNKDRLDGSEDFLRRRIKGQSAAIGSVLDIIKRARVGLVAGGGSKRGRPKGVLFFAGPTGVGKTETAKALAELLFGTEERMIRFDMSEYREEHSATRLLGAPPSYVGYDEGGQLTEAVKERPFSILLFDEIEKAHGSILDKFLQILDDGRLTDGKGETVYFGECILIFTSNLGVPEMKHNRYDPQSRRAQARPSLQPPVSSSPVPGSPRFPDYSQMKETVIKSIEDHFNLKLQRPELLNRFGKNFVVFDYIREGVDKEILELLLNELVKSAGEDRHLKLVIEEHVKQELLTLARQELHHGGRGVRNAIDMALVNPLNRFLFDAGVEKKTLAVVKGLKDNGENEVNRFELEIELKTLCNSTSTGSLTPLPASVREIE